MLREMRVLEIGGRMDSAVDLYAFAGTYLVEIGEIEAGETAFEEGIA